MKNKKGFTLVELLVIIAVIALVVVFAALAVNAARSKQRDASRLANVRIVQSALEDYFNENNTYPDGDLLALGDATHSACLGSDGFASDCSSAESTFLRVVPGTHEDGLEGIVSCGDPSRRAFCYTVLDDGVSYVIHFELENTLSQVGLQGGVNCATPDGMEAGTCAE